MLSAEDEKKYWPQKCGGAYGTGYRNRKSKLSQSEYLLLLASKASKKPNKRKSSANTTSTIEKAKPIQTVRRQEQKATVPIQKTTACEFHKDIRNKYKPLKSSQKAQVLPSKPKHIIIYDGVKIDISDFDHRTYPFLEKTYYDFLADLKKQESIQAIKGFINRTGQLPDYTNRINQEIYVLRYFLANFVEYFVMFSNWHNMLQSTHQHTQDHYDIVSIGCGSSCDYLAMYYVLNSNGVGPGLDYIGVDNCNWEQVSSPIKERQIETAGVVLWLKQNPQKFVDADMIVFAKSIGDLSSSSFEELLRIISSDICKLNKKRISILGSFEKRFHDRDIERYNKFIEVIRRKNQFLKYKRCHSNYPVDAAGHSNFSDFYPEMISMQRRSLENSCRLFTKNNRHCPEYPCPKQVLKEANTNTSDIDYSITILEK